VRDSIAIIVSTLALIMVSTLAPSCGGSKYDYAGYQTHKYFPLDGTTRNWTYYSEDTTYLMYVDMLTPLEQVGSTAIATLEYSQVDPYKLLWSVKWSSNSTDGIQIHGYLIEGTAEVEDSGDAGDDTGGTDTTAEIGTWVTFDPPIQFSQYQMAPGDSVTTSTGGVTYTSTLDSVEECPNNWVADPWTCLVFTLEGDDALPFVGSWSMATDYGVSQFQPASKSGTPWVLTEANWKGE